jgi:hypothetical protein
MIPKYILYWHNDCMRPTHYVNKNPLLLFNIKTKQENTTDTIILEKMFPFPRDGPFGMWGTPYGHYRLYDVQVLTDKIEYYKEIKKYL